MRCLFETPTVAGLALAVAQYKAGQSDEEVVSRQLAELERLSEEEVQARLTAE